MKKIICLTKFQTAFLIVFVISIFIFRPTFVQGYSMQPTLDNGDILLCNTFATPKIGDIVVIKPFEAVGNRYIIKRIVEIKDDMIFVEGDNKDNSYDSRAFGYISMDLVLGKVINLFP